MRHLSLLLFLISVSTFVSAGYNANVQGVVKDVMVYTTGDYIYFKLENQPTTHQSCNPVYFVVPETVPVNRRQMLLSRLLAAKATGEVTNIGYDQEGGCAKGYIRVYRVG